MELEMQGLKNAGHDSGGGRWEIMVAIAATVVVGVCG
jgi:hypothetical protein